MFLFGTLSFGQVPAPFGQVPAPVTAQQPGTQGSAGPAVTIKLVVVLSKYEGDKKISSVPYTLSLVPGKPGSIRAGSEIPVPTSSFNSAGTQTTTSYTLQQVGSQIDATVNPTGDGKYNLTLSVTDRDRTSTTNNPGVPNVPTFKNMSSSSSAILGNGESIQFTSSTERASNESLKIDVTLTVGNK
jgi:hypothetical protein